MAKWADYLISKVRYEENEKTKHIVKVYVHTDNDDKVSGGIDWTRKEVIDTLDKGKTFYTIFKGDNGNWKKGAKVEKILVDGVYYLKTVANNTKKDNLENLPEY
jgi:hypothetical protein